MHPDERRHLYRRALRAALNHPYGFAVFDDAARPERVVQVAAAIHEEDPEFHTDPVMEATNSYSLAKNDVRLEIKALLAPLGFAVDEEPFPSCKIDPDRPEEIVELIDQAFLALGADPVFTVRLYAIEPDDALVDGTKP